MGQTPILRAGGTRAPLAAISAISPAGQRACACQAQALQSAAVLALLAPLRRAGPGRLVIRGDGAPMHRRHVLTACVAHGAAPRMPLARLPASAPELHPDEGLWAHLQGGARRPVGCGHRPPRRGARREAVTRGRRTPRIIHGCVKGAGLEIMKLWSVERDNAAGEQSRCRSLSEGGVGS